MYLDKVYINQQKQPQPQQQQQQQFIHLKRFGLNFFRSYVLSTPGKEMIKNLMILIERIRQDYVENGELFELAGKVIEMIRELEEYSEGELEFEKVFIQATWTFYEKESLEETDSKKKSLPEYLKYASDRLNYEEVTVCALLAPITRDKLMKCLRDRLILDRMSSFIFRKPTGASLRSLFDSNDKNSLRLLYNLINGVYEVEALATEWTAFIRSHGQELMIKGNNYRTIEGIAAFKVQVDEIIRECFQSDPILQGTLKDAFETIMNGRGDRSAELLALYVHHKLQSESLEKDTIESESVLSMALLLFRYLHRKEAFDSFYKRTLAQRLLFNNSKDLSLEKQFISKLREECGGGFVSRMESMIKDVEQSVEMTRAFKKTDPSLVKGLPGVTNVTVISGLWPTGGASTTAKITSMPSAMEKLESDFNQFYVSQKKNCSLNWLELMGNVVIRSNFSTGRYNLNLTIPQALTLLQFNETGTCSIDKIVQATRLEKQLVEDTLRSLSDPLYPILLKEANSNAFKINEEFEFKGPGKVVPLYALQSPFLPAEEELTGLLSAEGGEGILASSKLADKPTLSLISERQGQVDAMLVRQMKHQLRSKRKDLVNHILANLGNICISAGDINNRINELIAKVFLAEEDSETIVYVP